MLEAIDRQPVDLERYDDELVRRIIERIRVISDENIVLQFKCRGTG